MAFPYLPLNASLVSVVAILYRSPVRTFNTDPQGSIKGYSSPAFHSVIFDFIHLIYNRKHLICGYLGINQGLMRITQFLFRYFNRPFLFLPFIKSFVLITSYPSSMCQYSSCLYCIAHFNINISYCSILRRNNWYFHFHHLNNNYRFTFLYCLSDFCF